MAEPLKKHPAGFASRFEKGKSGNPKGRPCRTLKSDPSAFDIILERQVGITLEGQQSRANLEEALLLKTYHDAVAGNPAAQREVLNMITTREDAVAARSKHRPQTKLMFDTTDPINANEALVLLDIATADPDATHDPQPSRLILQAWAVQPALKRRNLGPLNKQNRDEIFRCTKDSQSLIWPVFTENE